MSALSAKPGVRHSVSEWSNNNHQLSAVAQHERHVSAVIRQEGRSLRNETSCTVGSSFVFIGRNDGPLCYTFIRHLFSIDGVGRERYLSQAE